MPGLEDSRQMEEVQELLCAEFDRDPVAVLTGVYTGDGERNWVFYTLSTHIFGKNLMRLWSHFLCCRLKYMQKMTRTGRSMMKCASVR